MLSHELSRYNRHIILPEFGIEGQQKLKDSRVLVVGCGGLGSPVLQYLVAAGVGHIGIVDADVVSESNLQRQILYSTDEIGIPKVDAAKKRLNGLNPLVKITTYQTMFNETNSQEILSHYEIAVDCTDNFASRYVLCDACSAQNKPMVYGSVFQYEGQMAVLNYKGGKTYRDLFPEPPSIAPTSAPEGVLGVLPGIIGVLQATEVIKIITGKGKVLTNKLLLYNTLNLEFTSFNL